MSAISNFIYFEQSKIAINLNKVKTFEFDKDGNLTFYFDRTDMFSAQEITNEIDINNFKKTVLGLE